MILPDSAYGWLSGFHQLELEADCADVADGGMPPEAVVEDFDVFEEVLKDSPREDGNDGDGSTRS